MERPAAARAKTAATTETTGLDMNRQDKVIEQFRQAIADFDAEKLAREGKHPKLIKAMKDGLVSQYEDLLEERANASKPKTNKPGAP